MRHDPGLASWLQLSLTPGLSAAAIRALLRQFGLPQNILERKRTELAPHAGGAALEALDSDEVRGAVARALDWAAEQGNHVVTLSDPAYPKALLDIADPPPLLYARGRLELLNRAALAIVGSRNATAQGALNAEAFAKALSDAGLTIVSGLAVGIDAAAHRGGLAGASSTVAVLGTGVDIVYPSRNAPLAAEIATRGALVSEFALGSAPLAHNFPRRNRLISGLAKGCLVVEAALASGSLITAHAAADQGREVFAIPGSIHSPLAKGCHALIKTGAKLVESAEDVLAELLGFQPSGRASTVAPAGPSDESGPASGLLAHMGYEPVDVDSLCTRSGMSAEQVSSELLRLELAGRVAALPGGLYQRLEKAGLE
ncbi:MAG: DNA protecting protein DprA [Betaproteobacteria bacterium RIFCSPHIGHO2_12_FULL_69_13]|nr:MAG: DNA protecting protein DprA [Betaproteobacteria bacterium RIFCSPHIGHO2_12_FULL_69_13]OGA65227.1 MAG: DNA protecting protein DprA [Betaproteobacteria bacterium RIFCSPLOWO2_12_FULL_68_20]